MLIATRLRPIPFRFDADAHVYYVNDRPVPNVTSMLQRTGHVDPRYYTDESRERGRMVHALTAAIDLKSIDLARLVSPYRGYALAHAGAMARLRPTWLDVEVPVVHPAYKFGTRPDRVGKIFAAYAVLDEKSGRKEKWHGLQTALQAIGCAWKYGLRPELFQRFTLYLTNDGAFKNQPHTNRRDYDEAYEVIRECCRC